MDINFPLVLVIAVAFTGVVWLIDAIVFSPKRRVRVAEIESSMGAKGPDDNLAVAANGALAQAQQARVELLEEASREPTIVEYSKSFFPVLAIVLVLRSFIAEPFQIPSPSMVPTLEVGDFILVNKYTYGLRLPVVRTKVMDLNQPKRGDVMVFFPPHKPDTYYIKRVVGLPGDHIRYTNNVLYINGEQAPQELLASLPPARPVYELASENLDGVEHAIRKNITPTRFGKHGEWNVPEGHYFMMGDNRDNSMDSRAWGPVPESAIVGKAFAIWMQWKELGSLPSFKRVGGIQ